MSFHGANPNLVLLLRALVTLALGGFSLLMDDPATQSLIVGAVVGYWLREGEGQALRRRRVGRRGATSDAETETPTDRPPT